MSRRAWSLLAILLIAHPALAGDPVSTSPPAGTGEGAVLAPMPRPPGPAGRARLRPRLRGLIAGAAVGLSAGLLARLTSEPEDSLITSPFPGSIEPESHKQPRGFRLIGLVAGGAAVGYGIGAYQERHAGAALERERTSLQRALEAGTTGIATAARVAADLPLPPLAAAPLP